MHILLSNDDGVYAPGLKALYEALKPMAKLTVVAPDRDRSAAGKSLTLHAPLRPKVLDNGFVSVNGTPTDCVHLALRGWMKEKPDMVISGINESENLGDDVLCSGTVAAATEGRFLGFPAIAMSLGGNESLHFETAGLVAAHVLKQLLVHSLPSNTILNINVPDVPYGKLKGLKVARLGARHAAESMIKTTDPKGREIYWIGPPGEEEDAGEGTDFQAVREGFVSITPLNMNLTHEKALPTVNTWLKKVEDIKAE